MVDGLVKAVHLNGMEAILVSRQEGDRWMVDFGESYGKKSVAAEKLSASIFISVSHLTAPAYGYVFTLEEIHLISNPPLGDKPKLVLSPTFFQNIS